jgi:hypothetical protein
MSDKADNPSPDDISELAASLGEARRQLLNEVKLRRDVIKPLEQALRALKDPHSNAVALYEATSLLEKPPEGLSLTNGYNLPVAELRALADAELSELEFTFARDLRAAFKEKGVKLDGPPSELIADLFIIKPDLRKKQVQMTFSRQPVSGKKIKLDVAQVVSAYERARREICERKVVPDELLAELFEAYERTLKLAGKQIGTRASIVDCYRELVLVRQPLGFRKTPSKLSFVDYPKTHFAYDMLELRRRHKLTHQGHRLNLGTATIDVGSDTTRAMFLATGANEGQFIKDIYFTSEK